MSNLHIPLKLWILALSLLTLSACGDNNNSTQATTAVTEIPASVLTVPDPDGITAWITVDGGERIQMEITGGTASVTISGLTRDSHDILIVYEYTDVNGTVTIASASSSVDLSSGSASISFAEGDYDMDSYDSDGDGVSNAQELADGKNPTDSSCDIGFSLIGSCTL